MAVSVWVAAYSIELMGADLQTKQFWAKIQYFGIVILPLAWLDFSVNFPHHQDRPKKTPNWINGLLLVIPILTLLMVWTPGLNHLIWLEQRLQKNGSLLVLQNQWGFGFWFLVIFIYSAFAYGSYRLLRKANRKSRSYRGQLLAILVAVLVPWVGNAIYLFDLNPFSGLDLSTFGFAISGIALFWAVINQNMMNLVPIARSIVVENMQSAVIVVDEFERIVDINPSAANLLGLQGDIHHFISFHEAIEGWSGLQTAVQGDMFEHDHRVIQREKNGLESWFDFRKSPILDQKGKLIGYVMTFFDITRETETKRILQRRLEELTFLHTFSQICVEATNEDDLISQATQIIGESLFPDNFGVLLLDDATKTLRLHSSYNTTQKMRDMVIPIGQGITGQAVLSGEMKYVPDVNLDKNYIDGDPRTRSELCIPLKIANQGIGVLNVENARVAAFNENDQEILNTFAIQLSTTIEKIRLIENERIQSHQQAALLKLSSALSNALDEVQIGQSLVKTLKSSLGYDHVGLFLVDPVNGDRVLLASQGWPEARKGWRIPPGKGTSAQVIETGELRYIPDVTKTPEHVAGVKGGASEVDVPLKVGGEVLGVLTIERVQLNAFDESDFAILTAAATQASIAIERARLFHQVQKLAITDELTRMNNRRHFFDLAEAEIARTQRFGHPLSLMMLDLDHFKRINDTFGHPIGDVVLQSVARLCLNNVRQIDIMGRYGGEEFILLLPETDSPSAVQAAERLRTLVERRGIETPKGNLSVTISIGVATLTEEIQSLKKLIDQADEALLQAKGEGRNRVIARS
jgi:diguanylate cyclase (GGDEF)-like protein/PAS domain S-box-containing protein